MLNGETSMFCPRCATENKLEQRYCRQCGLTLPAVKLALEGDVDEAVGSLKKSKTALEWGLIIVVLGLLNAGINAFFHAWQSAIFSGAVGLLVGKMLILIAMLRIWRADKLLNPPEKKVEPEAPAINQSDYAATTLPPAPITEEIRRTPAPPHSVIENTTIKLKR
jgi:hypothetical protein